MTVPDDDIRVQECRAMLEAWDAGQRVPSIEMGGLGPDYDKAIQMMAMEFVRDGLTAPLAGDTDEARWMEWRKVCDQSFDRILTVKPLNETAEALSGAQFGAAQNLSFNFLHVHGVSALMNAVIEKGQRGRLIHVSKAGPIIERYPHEP